MAAEIRVAGSSIQPGIPHELFDSGVRGLSNHSGGIYHPFAVSADGQRFLIPRPVASLQGEAASTPITVVLNWAAALKK